MPSVQKHVGPQPKVNGQKQERKQGSILSRATKVSEIKDDYIKMVIYGVNRVGKTVLSCKFPKPLLLVSFEPAKTGGAKSVKNVPGVEYVKIESLSDAMKLAEELKSDTTFKTHVLDTATSLQGLILQELLNLPTVPEMLHWGMVSEDQYRQRSEKTREALRPFLNLNAHTVVLAKEKDHNPDKGSRQPKITRAMQPESYFAADLGSATVGWLHDCCDYICRLYLTEEVRSVKTVVEIAGDKEESEELVKTGKILRRLRTLYHPNYAAGFRSEQGVEIPEHIENPTWEKIKALIDGKRVEEKSTGNK